MIPTRSPRHTSRQAVMMLAFLGVVPMARGQVGEDPPLPSVAFHEAYYKESAQRNFLDAIEAYDRLLARPQLPPPIVAKTLVHKGLCLERLSRSDEAWDVYEKIRVELPAAEAWLAVAQRRQRQLLRAGVVPADLMPEEVRVYWEVFKPGSQFAILKEVLDPIDAAPKSLDQVLFWSLRNTTCSLAGGGWTDLASVPRKNVLVILFRKSTNLNPVLEREFGSRIEPLPEPAAAGLDGLQIYEQDVGLATQRWWASGEGVTLSSNDEALFNRVKGNFRRRPRGKSSTDGNSSGDQSTSQPYRAFRELLRFTRVDPGISIYCNIQGILKDLARNKDLFPLLRALRKPMHLDTLRDVLVRMRIESDKLRIDGGTLLVDVTLRELPDAEQQNRAIEAWRTARLDDKIQILDYVPSDALLSFCVSYEDAARKLREIDAGLAYLREAERKLPSAWREKMPTFWGDGGGDSKWDGADDESEWRNWRKLLDKISGAPEYLTEYKPFDQPLTFAVMRLPFEQSEEVAGLALAIKSNARDGDISKVGDYFDGLIRYLLGSDVDVSDPPTQHDEVALRVYSSPWVPLKPARAQIADVLLVGTSREAVEHILDAKLQGRTLSQDRFAAVNIADARDAQPTKVLTLAPSLLFTHDALAVELGEDGARVVMDNLKKATPICLFTVEDEKQITLSLRTDLNVLKAAWAFRNESKPATSSSRAAPSGGSATRPVTRPSSGPATTSSAPATP